MALDLFSTRGQQDTKKAKTIISVAAGSNEPPTENSSSGNSRIVFTVLPTSDIYVHTTSIILAVEQDRRDHEGFREFR